VGEGGTEVRSQKSDLRFEISEDGGRTGWGEVEVKS
jgi:hypothetical protein